MNAGVVHRRVALAALEQPTVEDRTQAVCKGNWRGAYANFDWVVTDRGDFPDIYARVYRAVAPRQLGEYERAETEWAAVRDHDLYALVPRAVMLKEPEAHPLEIGLPGNETTDLEAIAKQLGLPPRNYSKLRRKPY